MRYTYKNEEDVDWDNVTICSNPHLTPYERETHIYLNDDEDTAYIDTSQVVWMQYLLDHDHFTVDDKGIVMVGDDKVVGVKGTMPKNCIRTSKHPRQRFDKL